MNYSAAHIRVEFLLPVLVIPASICFAYLAVHLRRKDRFLARLFSEHRDLWDALGGPRGWQWSPPRGARAPYNSPTLHFEWWSAGEPSWLLRGPGLRGDYLSVRLGVRRWNFVCMPVFVGSALLFFLLVKITQ